MTTLANQPDFTPTIASLPATTAVRNDDIPTDEEPLYEIVDGVRVELPPMSSLAGVVASNLQDVLGPFAKEHRLGRAVTEMLFELDAQAELKRRPDVAFVSTQRWPSDRDVPDADDGWAVVPDLAVEVVSPTDRFEPVYDKRREYRQYGVRQVWIVLPRVREVHIYDGPTSVRILTEADSLDGGDLLPRFRLSLARLFSRRLD